ncbi:MAG: hypothetical protein WCA84_09875 [Ignavibacteriaceae bacterium]|jgi:hypothetical protein
MTEFEYNIIEQLKTLNQNLSTANIVVPNKKGRNYNFAENIINKLSLIDSGLVLMTRAIVNLGLQVEKLDKSISKKN